jgi:hypothetical protein
MSVSVEDKASDLLPRNRLYCPPASAPNARRHLMVAVRCCRFGRHKDRFKPAITVTALVQALPKHNRCARIIYHLVARPVARVCGIDARQV